MNKIYFPDNLKELRSRNKLSQEQLGTIVGKGKNAIYYWESGTREPNLEDIFTLSHYFHVPADVLLFTDMRMPYSPTVDQRIIDDLANLDPEKQEIITNMIDALKK